VKTPAWPTVVCPPPAGAQGQWQVMQDAEGLTGLFMDPARPDVPLGFALQGKAVAQRQALAGKLAPWL
jgi:rubredoxin-NAD+ reductase